MKRAAFAAREIKQMALPGATGAAPSPAGSLELGMIYHEDFIFGFPMGLLFSLIAWWVGFERHKGHVTNFSTSESRNSCGVTSVVFDCSGSQSSDSRRRDRIHR